MTSTIPLSTQVKPPNRPDASDASDPSNLTLSPPEDLVRTAIIDPTGIYRYSLTRQWDANRGRVCWIMLNPSTADESVDDPTIRRVIGFSKAWGYGSLIVVNLFALRSMSPQTLKIAADPIGPDNDLYIAAAALTSEAVLAAWSFHAGLFDRDQSVLDILHRIDCPVCVLGLTDGGRPRHPLYVPGATLPVPWNTGRVGPCAPPSTDHSEESQG